MSDGKDSKKVDPLKYFADKGMISDNDFSESGDTEEVKMGADDGATGKLEFNDSYTDDDLQMSDSFK